jgi:hypothetical protein
MPRALCLHCGEHPAALPASICRACIAQARRDLDDLPGWHEALLCRPIGAITQRVTSSHQPPAPAAPAALDARTAIKAGLVSWALLALEESRVEHLPATDTVRAIATWLGSPGIDAWIICHGAAGDWCHELEGLVERARRIAAPGRRDVVPIGACPDCSGLVVADPSTADAWCLVCRDRGDIAWWRRRLPVADEWLPAGRLRMHLALAYGVKVTDHAVYKAGQRGQIPMQWAGAHALYSVPGALTYWHVVAGEPRMVHPVHETA